MSLVTIKHAFKAENIDCFKLNNFTLANRSSKRNCNGGGAAIFIKKQ